MEDLIDLVYFIREQNTITDRDVTAALGQSPTMHRLYSLIYSGDVTTKDDAMERLYGDKGSKRSLNELRRRLTSKLLDVVLTHGPSLSNLSDTEAAYNRCSKYLHLARILKSSNHHDLGLSLADKAQNIANKFGFTDYSILAHKLSLIPSGVFGGDIKLLERSITDLSKKVQALQAELEIECLYAQIMAHHANTQSTIPRDTLEKHEHTLNSICNKYDLNISLRFTRMVYMVRVSIADLKFESTDVIKYSRQAVKFFENQPFNMYNTIFGFEVRIMSAQIRLNNPSNIGKLYEKNLKQLKSGSTNWFLLNLYYVIHLFYSRNYKSLVPIFCRTFRTKYFKKLHPNRKEIWYILEAYTHLLIECGKVPPELVKKHPLRQFRLYRFLNDVPIFSKDKRGVNVPILIIHILFLLQQRKHDHICDRIDALKQYSRRYLRRDENFRSNCFIKLLVLLPKTGFNKMRTERHAKPLLKKLESVPIHQTRQGIETEPIPYEHLWEMTVDMLD